MTYSKCRDIDFIQPTGTVELECSECGWSSWFDALDPEVEAAKTTPHVCRRCKGIPEITEKSF
jgi:hypothetical protein